jgi:hypothetical protein
LGREGAASAGILDPLAATIHDFELYIQSNDLPLQLRFNSLLIFVALTFEQEQM